MDPHRPLILPRSQAGRLLRRIRDPSMRCQIFAQLLLHIVDTCNLTAELLDFLHEDELRAFEQELGPSSPPSLSPHFVPGLLHVMLSAIELRQALISYQDYHMSVLTLAGHVYFNFSPACASGRYALTMSRPLERELAHRIVQISADEAHARRHGHTGEGKPFVDTSQTAGGWNNFRNEHIKVNGMPRAPFRMGFRPHSAAGERRPPSAGAADKLGGAEHTELPSHGIVDFDYISTATQHRLAGVAPMEEDDFLLLLHDLDLPRLWVRTRADEVHFGPSRSKKIRASLLAARTLDAQVNPWSLNRCGRST